MESNKLKGFSHSRNNEIHDIMDKPTGWIIKWGTSILMLFVVIIIVCSCFIKYPDRRNILLTIADENLDFIIHAPSNGIIDCINICNGDSVTKNDTLIIYRNSLNGNFSNVILSPINGIINFPKVRKKGTSFTENEILFMFEPYNKDLKTCNIMFGYVNYETRKLINKGTKVSIKLNNEIIETGEIVNISNIPNEENLYYLEVNIELPPCNISSNAYNAEIIISDVLLINKIFQKMVPQ